ncbi:MAG: hypothetical protein FWC41_13810, partial [Firmicutes bacterium]|nr:hypothetical protein [Bacillota bacterium]
MLFVYNNLIANIDTIPLNNETEFLELDSLLSNSFEWPLDTILAKKDTLSSKKLSPNALSTSIKYLSQDSIIINLNSKRVYLFEAAKANYEDIELTAAFMDFGFTNSELYASGVADSCGHIHGPPIFKQGSSEFCSQEIRYNFNTKKGKVTKVITNEGEGFVHGRYVKHVDDKTSYIKDGQYTTCNLPHPHFQIRFSKAKVIQEEKIITGPAYMSFGNIPTPLAIPFGYFPLNKERSSGILMPRYGEGAQRGFYFEDFGYYFGISDRFDLQLRGDITTRGNWAAKSEANYVFRYKCNGNIFLSFAQNFRGERNTPMRERDNDFRVLWRHNQDPKAHPTTRFSAYVNVLSRSFSRNNPTSTSDYLSNEFASSLNFQTNANGIFYVDASVLYSQNTHNKNISVSLPELNMSVRQFYPFRKKHKVGKLKWYDNISLQWRSSLKNRISTKDSLFFKPQTWQEIQSGMQHNIPLTIPIKVGKSSNWNTNVTFTEKWHFQRNTKQFSEISIDTVKQGQINDVFQRGFYALHDLSMSTAFSTKVFFTYSFKKGDLKAIRHVLSPNLSFNYSPNLSNNAYGTYFNTLIGETVEYSYFTDGVSRNTRAIANVTLNNNLEMKVRSKKDSITGTRKVKLFDNISISCGYDFAADSLNWQPLLISGRTVLFSFMDVNF